MTRPSSTGLASILLLLLSVAAGCSSTTIETRSAPGDDANQGLGDDAGGGAGDDGGATDADAGHTFVTPPPLGTIPNQGGPIVASPEIVTVTWSGDPIAADLEAFDDWFTASPTWATMMSEWGVGPGTHGGTWRVPTPAPAVLDDTAIQKILSDAFDAGSLPLPNGSRIYTIYPPAGTTVQSFGSEGCTSFQAYHYAYTAKNALAIYAVTPRCDGGAQEGMSPLDYVTWGQSHEVMEASSDPKYDQPAWRLDTQSASAPFPGENADLCVGHPTKIDGHMITRNWSNVAVTKGERPCVPAPPGPMFGAFADPPEITLAPGTSTKVTVRLYATAAMPAFQIMPFPTSKDLSAKLDAKTGNDGDVLTLTVSASSSYVEVPGENVVELYAETNDYNTRRGLIVHAK